MIFFVWYSNKETGLFDVAEKKLEANKVSLENRKLVLEEETKKLELEKTSIEKKQKSTR
jgi:hypothetical protein